MPATFHIGSRIKEVWKRSGLKGAEFAKQLHRQRQSIYHLFRQESVDTLLLKKISEVLDHDFFQDYSDLLAGKRGIGTVTHQPLESLSHAINELSTEVKHLAGTHHKTQAGP